MSVGLELPTRRHTTRFGTRLADVLAPGDMVMLSGDLGAGKTFLARAVARRLGVPVSVGIVSPTFTLVQEYETSRGILAHADLYRLREGTRAETAAEIARLGLAERRAEGAILLVEWGEGFAWELGGDAQLEVRLEHAEAGRRVSIDGPKRALLVES